MLPNVASTSNFKLHKGGNLSIILLYAVGFCKYSGFINFPDLGMFLSHKVTAAQVYWFSGVFILHKITIARIICNLMTRETYYLLPMVVTVTETHYCTSSSSVACGDC